MTNNNYSIDSIISQDDGEPRLLESVSTLNGQLSIEENEEYRWIRDNYQAYYSIIDKSRPERLVLPYLQTMMAALLFVPEPKSTILLGAGGGSILRFFNEYIPDNHVEAIDYDKNIIAVTQKYFFSDFTSTTPISNVDARQYIINPPIQSADLMFVDLFSHGSIPEFFTDLDFYQNCKQCCNSGVVIFNLIIKSDSSFKSIMSLLLSVFKKQCLYLTVADYKNVIVLAFGDDAPLELDVIELRKKCESLRYSYNLDFEELLDEIISTNVCTDDILQF